jgi:single-stranded-DNA-specific exonuclease
MLKWISRLEDNSAQGEPPLSRLLRARGFDDPASAHAFLHPSQDQLLNPAQMPGASDAARLIEKARAQGRGIMVYGDYDVDGVTATALLTGFLAEWGARPSSYIPSRHNEGYGLNEAAVRAIAAMPEIGLLITVDCGISAASHIALARSLGLDVIVTDHHRPGETLPDCPIVNPILGYPYPSLCGAGVAFKLCQALDNRRALSYIDLAALGTVADVVPLTGENRAIAALGIERINSAPRPGILALMERAGVEPGAVSAGKIAFQLAPRLNAGGRVGDANRSLQLLTARTIEEARPLAQALDDENTRRKSLEALILKEADAQLEGFDFLARRSIVLAGDGWNAGVLGLAASRLVERYNLPTVLLRREGDVLTGSCRSIPGIDIFQALTAVSGLMTRFGGHSQAAGLALEAGKFEDFCRALDANIAQTADPDCFIPAARYDMELPLAQADEAFVDALRLFEPTGFGNPAPVFLAEADVESAEPVGAGGAHLRLRLRDQDTRLAGIAFSMGDRAGTLPRRIRALYAPKLETFRGHSSIQCQVKAIGEAGGAASFRAGARDMDGLFQTFLTNRLYNREYEAPAAGYYSGYGEIIARIQASPRGTAAVAATQEGALAFLSAAQAQAPDRMDVCIGRWPGDPRGFNALCLLPPGPPPAGYEVFSLDAPSGFWGMKAFEPGEEPSRLGAYFPDVDELRAVYTAVRDLTRRPFAAYNLRQILNELSRSSGLRAARVFSALAVLRDMKLLDFAQAPAKISMLPLRKADPRGNPLFQWMRRLSTWGGEPLDKK